MKTIKWLSLFVLVVIVGVVFLPDVEGDQTWTQCAVQNGTCTFTGTRLVRYGTAKQNRTKQATTSIACTTAQFGRDPAVGQVKNCWYAGAAPPPPSGSLAGAPTLTPGGPNHTTMYTVNTPGAVIDGHTFNGHSDGFTCFNPTANNITIRNSVFRNCGSSAINPENISGLVVENNTFIDSEMGVYFQGNVATYPTANSSNNTIQYNWCHNLTGPINSFSSSCVKFNGVVGPGNVIRGNVSTQDSGVGSTEDIFSIFLSHGEAVSPIIIEDNCADGANNTSNSGTAYNTGDLDSSYLTFRRNTTRMVSGTTRAGGVGINGGDQIRVEDHIIYCRGINQSVQQWCQFATWAYYGPGSCTNITITGNQADIRDSAGNRVDARIDYGGCTSVTETGNNYLATLSDPIANCQHR